MTEHNWEEKQELFLTKFIYLYYSVPKHRDM